MNSNSINLRSVLTCPECGHAKEETMPKDACMFFYVCEECDSRLMPKHGDCCVFCSYASVKCPPIQSGAGCPWAKKKGCQLTPINPKATFITRSHPACSQLGPPRGPPASASQLS